MSADKNNGVVVVLSTVVDPGRDLPQNFIELSNEGLHALYVLRRTFNLVVVVPRDGNLRSRARGKELA